MAFKKPLASLKTSAPLKSSDRRKLKLRILSIFHLTTDDANLLVPDPLLAIKFTTHLDVPGLAYLAPDGTPLWFTIGQGSDDLIPTVYTLWKNPDLLPCLSTPAAVIPRLTDGAHLMIPGVIHCPPTAHPEQLVAVAQYTPDARAPPLAVGRMALDAADMRAGAKGKAVHVLHTYGDRLWDMGPKSDPPDAVPVAGDAQTDAPDEEASDDDGAEGDSAGDKRPVTPPPSQPLEGDDTLPLTPQEVSSILRTALIHAITSSLAALPPSAFPLPATTVYTAHILPARPAHPPPSTPVDIKHSAHKSLTAFLRRAEKDGLLRLKDPTGKRELLVAGVDAAHPDVRAHAPYTTLGAADARRAKQEERAAQGARSGVREIGVAELYKPHLHTLRLFEEAGKDTSALYTAAEAKAVLNAYIAAQQLVNAHQPQFINVDNLLSTVLPPGTEFLKREDAARRLLCGMQAWHRIAVDGRDPITTKGGLRPVCVGVALRQGRRACTLITDFEPYGVGADALAGDLRGICASATAVAELPGKKAGKAGMEVMVQGSQVRAVVEYLLARGVPRRCIQTADVAGKKKK